jgi:acetylornithine deacetylase/succinyl-diaminopimelate desuccinylase-like protein
VQYGPGDAAAAHSPDEWVDVDEVTDTARGLVRLILQVCG